MPISKQKKIAFIFEACDVKGSYPLERLLILWHAFNDYERFLFIKGEQAHLITRCKEYGVTPVLFEKTEELARALRNLQIDTVLHDGKSTTFEYVEKLKPFCQTYIQFDNFLDGHMLADYNLFTYVDELLDFDAPNAIVGSHCFAVPDKLLELTPSTMQQEMPRIVVYFEDGDRHFLTYRTLRHLVQLQIPVHISIIIDEEFSHPTEELQMLLLSRKNTALLNATQLPQALSDATIVIGNANYTPFKIATLGIPYIALAQNELELGNSCVKEEHGFIHLGLGRKIKQSSLQNAIMELLLHDERRARAISRQKKLAMHQNNEILQTLITEFMNGQPKLTFL